MRVLYVLALVLFAATAHATGEMVCSKELCVWTWDNPGSSHQVEWQVEGNPSKYVTVPSNKVNLAPPDRLAAQRMRVRTRRLNPDSAWSSWSEWTYGVPVGFDPDWDRDGIILPADYTFGYEQAFKNGWQWPRSTTAR